MSELRSYAAPGTSADNAQAAADIFSPEDIHSQLKRILESAHFRDSLRLTCFLKFVVETVLAGKPETIKAYTIAVEALGRDQDFDPQRDPIVRVEAGRLRQALARHYAEGGRNDPLVIELPRGSYVPVFRCSKATGVVAPPASGDATSLALLARRWPKLVANRRESEMLHAMVSRQSKELAAQILNVRRFLADSRALLNQPLPGIASHPSPPLMPTVPQPVNPVADNPAEGEVPTSPKQPKSAADRHGIRGLIAAAKVCVREHLQILKRATR